MAVESIKNWGDFDITDILEGITQHSVYPLDLLEEFYGQ